MTATLINHQSHPPTATTGPQGGGGLQTMTMARGVGCVCGTVAYMHHFDPLEAT